MSINGKIEVFGGNSNPALLNKICNYLKLKPGEARVSSFSDGEPDIEILKSVANKDVFVVQSMCPPVAHNFIEFTALIDALKRSAAKRITAVIPYFGYGRQDRRKKPGERVPITAKMAADFITTAGADRIMIMDLHAGQIQAFFNRPVDNLFPTPIFQPYLQSTFGADACLVSPDAGGVERTRAMAKRIGASLAIFDKRREEANVVKEMNIIGDVNGLIAVIYDDIADTGGTLRQAAFALKEKGAKEVHACCTHGVLSGPAIENIDVSPISSLVVTDTIPLGPKATACKKISVISVSELLAKAIQNINIDESVSSLFA
jgi:ribose-phosphate pyrophosphokinase